MAESNDLTEVVALQNAYGTTIDSRDWKALRGCLSDDAVIDYGRPPRFCGNVEEFMQWVEPLHEAFGATLHQMTTHAATVDGDIASASCYLHAVIVSPDGLDVREVYGQYADRLVRIDGRWLFQHRAFRPIWRKHNVLNEPAVV